MLFEQVIDQSIYQNYEPKFILCLLINGLVHLEWEDVPRVYSYQTYGGTDKMDHK